MGICASCEAPDGAAPNAPNAKLLNNILKSVCADLPGKHATPGLSQMSEEDGQDPSVQESPPHEEPAPAEADEGKPKGKPDRRPRDTGASARSRTLPQCVQQSLCQSTLTPLKPHASSTFAMPDRRPRRALAGYKTLPIAPLNPRRALVGYKTRPRTTQQRRYALLYSGQCMIRAAGSLDRRTDGGSEHGPRHDQLVTCSHQM